MESDYSDHILALWDQVTKNMDTVYTQLINGKSELATVLLNGYHDLHNSSQRMSLEGWLKDLETAVELRKYESMDDDHYEHREGDD